MDDTVGLCGVTHYDFTKLFVDTIVIQQYSTVMVKEGWLMAQKHYIKTK